MSEIEQVELEPVKEPPSDSPEKLIEKLMFFFNDGAEEVIKYIVKENVPPHYITPNRRIDLHPAREYLLRLVRVTKDVIQIKRLLNNEGDELDSFFD